MSPAPSLPLVRKLVTVVANNMNANVIPISIRLFKLKENAIPIIDDTAEIPKSSFGILQLDQSTRLAINKELIDNAIDKVTIGESPLVINSANGIVTMELSNMLRFESETIISLLAHRFSSFKILTKNGIAKLPKEAEITLYQIKSIIHLYIHEESSQDRYLLFLAPRLLYDQHTPLGE